MLPTTLIRYPPSRKPIYQFEWQRIPSSHYQKLGIKPHQIRFLFNDSLIDLNSDNVDMDNYPYQKM
jgi:hypothetical protein